MKGLRSFGPEPLAVSYVEGSLCTAAEAAVKRGAFIIFDGSGSDE